MTGEFRRFHVYRDGDRTRVDVDDDLLGWGCQFPSGELIVDWHRDAYPEEDRLEEPHFSRYGTVDDVEQGTGGTVEFVTPDDGADNGGEGR